MTTHTVHAAFIAYGTRDLDEIERTLYTQPTWKLVHPQTGKRVELVNHPAWQPLYLLMLQQGWFDDNEMSTIGYAAPATTDAANDAHSDHENEGNEE